MSDGKIEYKVTVSAKDYREGHLSESVHAALKAFLLFAGDPDSYVPENGTFVYCGCTVEWSATFAPAVVH